jgi:hypothetical protein
MNAAWALVEFLPRRASSRKMTSRWSLLGWCIRFFERRAIPDGAAIHASVLVRRGTPSDFKQPNIPVNRIEV